MKQRDRERACRPIPASVNERRPDARLLLDEKIKLADNAVITIGRVSGYVERHYAGAALEEAQSKRKE